MRSTLIIFALFFALAKPGQAQVETVSFEMLDSLQSVERKKVMVFIHAEWCRYCKVMKNKVFKDEQVASKIQKEYYFVDLDAESKVGIKFRGYDFKFLPTGKKTGVHELAQQLGAVDGKLEFPTLTILNADYEIIFQYNAFLSKRELLKVFDRL